MYVKPIFRFFFSGMFQKSFFNWTPDAEKINKQLKLFSISVGTEDSLYESVKKSLALFTEKM